MSDTKESKENNGERGKPVQAADVMSFRRKEATAAEHFRHRGKGHKCRYGNRSEPLRREIKRNKRAKQKCRGTPGVIATVATTTAMTPGLVSASVPRSAMLRWTGNPLGRRRPMFSTETSRWQRPRRPPNDGLGHGKPVRFSMTWQRVKARDPKSSPDCRSEARDEVPSEGTPLVKSCNVLPTRTAASRAPRR